MLYDPKWEGTKTKPSLAGLIAWLERQDPKTKYDWFAPRDCLICRYLQGAYGYGGAPWNELNRDWRMDYEDVVGSMKNYHVIGRRGAWTFGAALKRARALAAQ